MFCPTCVRSYPEDSEKCPKCQGPLTNVIEIFADDEPAEDESPVESAAPTEPAAKVIPLTNDAPEAPEMPSEAPVAAAQSPDEALQKAKAAFGSSTPDLWIASTILCTILLLVVVFFDNSKSKPKPQPSPTSQTEQLQAQEEEKEPKEKIVASEEPEGPTSEELRTVADATLLKAKRSREAGELETAEQQAEEAYRLHSEIEDNEEEIAYSLQELALVHVEMNNLVKAKSELNQAQRLVFSGERKQILADLTGGRGRTTVQESSSTMRTKRPSLGEASSVPQAAPRATRETTTDDDKPVARRRMKEIEAYKPDEDEVRQSDVPLGQQDVVESYRGTRRGKSKIPGLR